LANAKESCILECKNTRKKENQLKASPKQSIDYKAIDVLNRASSDLKLRIKERLHIISEKPETNKQMGSQSSYELKTILVAN
jgi:hypothetical protein